MAKRLRAWAMLIALATLLAGCVPGQSTDSPDEFALPEPSEEPVNMFLGERLPSRMTSVPLYYPMSDGAGFSTVAMGIRADSGETLIEAAVKALLNPTGGEESMASIGDAHLLSCEFGCGIATVNLSIDARNVQNEQELLAQLTAIGNTLLGIEGVRGVNVLIGGQSESFGQLPLGVQTEVIPSVTASYAQLLAEHEHLLSGSGLPVTRHAVLYFPTKGKDWLIPELRDVTFESDDIAGVLIDALTAGPQDESCAVASIPAGVELLDPGPTVETLSTGEHVVTLNFPSTLANYLAFSGLEIWELAGSVALTVCSFLPEIDAVRILVEEDPITVCEIGETLLTFKDGMIRRSDFSNRVGSVATLYLATGDLRLQPEQRPVSMRSALSPRSLLSVLFSCKDQGDAPLRFPAPDSVYPADVLGIQVSGNVARVNLSGSFYRACQQLTPDEERALVYSIVNTLCGMEDINAVRFYVEGTAASTLAGSIYLKNPLMANPGIVAVPDATGEP